MPTRDTAWPAGTPCWVDYGAVDVDAAKALYADLFGWTYGGGEPEYGGYLTCEAQGKPAAGMGPKMSETDPTAWTTYFATDDADASVTRIRENGGTVVVEPMQVGPMGRMVIALDPEGNLFGLWESGQHTGMRIYNEPGSAVWNEAAVQDIEAAQTFYTAVFGFQFDKMDMDDGAAYYTFSKGGDPLGGLGAHQPDLGKGWTTCFAVTSTDDTVTALEKAGGKVTMPAQDTDFGRIAVFEDPWGAPFSVMQTSG